MGIQPDVLSAKARALIAASKPSLKPPQAITSQVHGRPMLKATNGDLPDFSQVDYTFDFSKEDYSIIPPGAERHSKDYRLQDTEEEIEGKLETSDGYLDPDGRFVTHGRFVTWYDDAKIKKMREGWTKHGKIHGLVILYFEDGSNAGERPYVDGERHGIHRMLHKNGQIGVENLYLHGKEHGVFRGWYKDGRPKYERPFVNGQKEGVHREWYANGQQKNEQAFQNSKRNGAARMWYADGFVEAEGTFVDDLFEGEYIDYWKIDGSEKPVIQKKGACRRGEKVGIWTIGFIRSGTGYASLQVDTRKWGGGTREEFLVKMILSARSGNEIQNFQLNVPAGMPTTAGLQGTSLGSFLSDFGRPDLDEPYSVTSGTIGQQLRRLWVYQCSDGPLVFDVSFSNPSQQGFFKLILDRKRSGWDEMVHRSLQGR